MQKRQNSGYTSIGHLLERGKEDEVLHDVIKSLCDKREHVFGQPTTAVLAVSCREVC